METLIKVGNARHLDDPNLLRSWLDGQIVMRRPDGFKWGRMERKHFAIIRTTEDYWTARGSTDWKSDSTPVLEFSKIERAVDSNGRYPWEDKYLWREKAPRTKDWFIDFEWLATQGIPLSWIEDIYNHDKETEILNIGRSLTTLLTHESERRPFEVKNQGITQGTYSIGSGLDYATVTAFVTDFNSGGGLTGDLTGEHANEETAISTAVICTVSTNGYLLKLTAASGAEHNGGAYGNGARVTYGTYNSIKVDAAPGESLQDIEFSKLALDATGNGNRGLYLADLSGGYCLINRMLIAVGGTSSKGIEISTYGGDFGVWNNICYVTGAASSSIGIDAYMNYSAGQFVEYYNNTIIGFVTGMNELTGSPDIGTFVAKNNLLQGNTTSFSANVLSAITSHAYNVSEDANSPDVAYRSLNCHDGNSCFQDYANNDYRLVGTGDEISTLDDGENLSGTFTDDIQGQTRSIWYIGASEYETAGGAVQSLLAIPYDIRNSISSNIAIPFDLLNIINSGLEIPYDILNSIGSDVEIPFDIRNIADRDLQVIYDILSSLSPVQSDVALPYDIKTIASSVLQIPFDIFNLVISGAALQYSILNQVLSDVAVPFDIKLIADSALQLVFDMRQIAPSNVQLLFDMGGLVKSHVAIIYSIQGDELTLNVFNNVFQKVFQNQFRGVV